MANREKERDNVSEANVVKCVYCGSEMIRVLAQTRPNPITNKPTREETWHCPHCGLVLLFARPDEAYTPAEKLKIEEKLRSLGYM